MQHRGLRHPADHHRRAVRGIGRALAALAMAMATTLAALAAEPFPARAVHIVVPFPPGGGTDVLARILQPALQQAWGQPVVVENRAGAAGAIGAEYVAAQPADGYTLMMSSTASLTAKNVARFAPVTLVSASPYVIVVNAKLTVATVAELIAHARRNPGKVSFGSSGIGAASHLAGELFKAMAGVDMLHVPYKGTGQALTDLLGGQIDVMFAPAETVMQQVQAGRLRALAVTSARRATALPALPTAAESGLPGYEAIGWFGLLAPAKTPPAIVARISSDANNAMADPEVRRRILDAGAEPSGDTPEAFARFIRDDMAKWARLIAERGIPTEQ